MTKTKNTTWKQKLNSNDTLKHDIKNIFKHARKQNSTHSEICETITTMIYKNQKYTTLPKYMQSSINGYIFANFDFMHEFVTWSHWYDGIFVGTNLKYGKDFDQSKVVSDHVYNGTENKY